MNTKVCSKCREVKLLSEFSKSKRDGYQSECKVCKKESQAKYRAANPEKVKERNAKWCAANSDYHAEYKKANPEKCRASRNKWAKANPEKVKKNTAKWCAANREKKKKQQAKWCAANPEKIKEYQATWAKANLDKRRATASKRRAIKLKAIPTWLTEEEYQVIDAIYAEAKRLEAETGIKHHVDHIHPLQGKLVCGFHCPTNLQILTEVENCSKGNKFTPYVESDLTD